MSSARKKSWRASQDSKIKLLELKIGAMQTRISIYEIMEQYSLGLCNKLKNEAPEILEEWQTEWDSQFKTKEVVNESH